MTTKLIRIDGRTLDQVRPISVQFDVLGYATCSVLLECGNTKVLVSVGLQRTVPRFLKGKGVGWLSAEYSMLPWATQQRTNREAVIGKRSARSIEISRLIGRCLRPMVDLSVIGEKTISIDCDVLQADGGTRVACITAASIALQVAAQRWQNQRIISGNILSEPVAAVSVGLIDGVAYLDLCYEEDSNVDADFNFVVTKSGDIIEIQGTAEKAPVKQEHFEQLKELAFSGIKSIFNKISEIKMPDSDSAPGQFKIQQATKNYGQRSSKHSRPYKPSPFSIGNRLKSSV